MTRVILVRPLNAVRWRIFLTAWLVFSVHFATNIVREHYPAFSIVDHLSFRVDEYLGFHSDIFEHSDGHAYIANNVAVSVLAAVPLLLFDPALDALEARSLRRLARLDRPPEAEYRTHYPNRRAFFQIVTERGLDLRFGGAAVVTSAFFMAPASALAVVLMFQVLVLRGVGESRGLWLALLFAFGTPVFFRTAHLNHNMFLMYATFLAFYLLWSPGSEDDHVPPWRRAAAGALAGFCLAADYGGVVPLIALYGYLLLRRTRSASWSTAFRESLPFVAGSVPPVAFLFWSQWVQFGNLLLPAQYWMPEVNYTDRGWRGFSWPSIDLFLKNLFDPRYGLLVFGPVLALGLVPTRRSARLTERILPRPERLFLWTFLAAMLIFYAANQYSRMQFNTGVRYLVPLIPLLFLAAADHLVRLPRIWKWIVTTLAIAHSWVLTVFRESVFESWRLFLSEGVQLPWLRVLGMTSAADAPIVHSPILPLAILVVTLGVVTLIWRVGGSPVPAGRSRPAGAAAAGKR